MDDTRDPNEIEKSKRAIPNAFSHCANCGISYHQSSNPVESVLLVCLHSFCRTCINNGCLRSDKGDPNLVTCCKCKCNSNRADCGINLLADVDLASLDSSTSSGCSSCNDQMVATSRCTVCNDMLCDACVSAHRRVKLTRDHPIVPFIRGISVSSTTRVSKRYSCAKHSSEKLHYFCEQCNKVTCKQCHEITGEHYSHSKLDVSQAAIGFKGVLKTQLQNLNEKEQTVVKAIDIINEKVADVESAESKALDEVREYYNTCMEVLRNRMNSLGSEIKKIASSKRVLLEKMKDDINQLRSRLEETIKAVAYVAESGDPIAVLSVKKGMSHHTSTLLKLKCQVPNPSHRLNIQLQKEPSLLAQVMPNTGRILVDGVVHYPQQPISNGVTHSPSNSLPYPSTNNYSSPALLVVNSQSNHNHTSYHSPSQSQGQSTTKATTNYSYSSARGSPALAAAISQPAVPLPRPQQFNHTIHHKPSHSPSSVPPLSRQGSVLFPGPPVAPLVSPEISINPPRKSPPTANLNDNSEVSHQNSISPLPKLVKANLSIEDNSLKIANVMSLASTNEGRANGNHVVTARDKDSLAVKKRRKTPLSPYHISSQHRPDDPNEDYCAVCHNGGELVCCDTCPKVFHATCHVPELTGTPSNFSCSLCWDEKTLPVEPEVYGIKRKAPSGLSNHNVKICEKILLRMFCHKRSIAFHLPVPKTVKHYSSLIKHPMDFVTIRSKLRRQHFNHYDSVKEFIDDMKLVFSNCEAFNGPASDYTESSRIVQDFFVEQIRQYFPEHGEDASNLLPVEDVMNLPLAKKKTHNDDPVVHIN